MCIFPSAPKVPPPPVMPKPQDAIQAGNNELLRRAGAKGFGATILGGALQPQPNLTPPKTLLGG